MLINSLRMSPVFQCPPGPEKETFEKRKLSPLNSWRENDGSESVLAEKEMATTTTCRLGQTQVTQCDTGIPARDAEDL